jgi:hypothetical protein
VKFKVIYPWGQIFSIWRTHIWCNFLPQSLHSTNGSSSRWSFFISLNWSFFITLKQWQEKRQCHKFKRKIYIKIIVIILDDTYVCGCVGSSPNVTVSPGMSLKHFWQKVYLSQERPNPLYRLYICHKMMCVVWMGDGGNRMEKSNISKPKKKQCKKNWQH